MSMKNGIANKIIKLGFAQKDGYSAREISAYGLDASTIIEAVLGVTPRAKEVDDELGELSELGRED